MLKFTDAKELGDLWVQCEKVVYVKHRIVGKGQSTILGLVSGVEVEVRESASEVRRKLCPSNH